MSAFSGQKGKIMEKSAWTVKVWGVRGSFPVPEKDFLEYGGNTSCVSADCGEKLIVFDAGSGLIRLGNAISHSGRKRVDILLSHLHIDHCLGLFGFRLLHDPEAQIHLYGSAQEGRSFRENLERLFCTPYWPLGLEDFPARIELHEVAPGTSFRLAGEENAAEGIEVRTLAGNHPNGSLLYRLESGEKSIVYALDCETDGDTALRLAEFSHGADLLIWDANFTEEELGRRTGWGHSSWRQGIALRRAANAKTVLMTHFSSDYTDEFLRGQEQLAAQADTAVLFAKEGTEVMLSSQQY